MAKKWYDKPKQKAVYKEKCADCGSERLSKFTAGGMLQVRCRDCQGRHSISVELPFRDTETIVEGQHGYQTVQERVTKRVPAGESILEHEKEAGSFRNPAKNFVPEEE